MMVSFVSDRPGSAQRAIAAVDGISTARAALVADGRALGPVDKRRFAGPLSWAWGGCRFRAARRGVARSSAGITAPGAVPATIGVGI